MMILPEYFLIVAVVIRLLSGLGYITATLRGRAKPNAVTWFVWGLTAGIAFVAQLIEGVGASAWVTGVLVLGPAVTFAAAMYKNRSMAQFTPSSVACGVLALVGVGLWLATDDPVMAILFSILADTMGSLPTVIKAYRDPKGEYPPTFLLSIVSMTIVLMTIDDLSFASVAFPGYILFINLVIFVGAQWSPGVGKKRLSRV